MDYLDEVTYYNYEITFNGSLESKRYVIALTLKEALAKAKKKQRSENKSDNAVRASFFEPISKQWVDITGEL